MVEIIQKDLLPAVTTYMEKLAQTASLKKSVVPGISVSAEASLLSRLTELAETMTKDLEAEIDKDAKANYRTRSQQINMILTEYYKTQTTTKHESE